MKKFLWFILTYISILNSKSLNRSNKSHCNEVDDKACDDLPEYLEQFAFLFQCNQPLPLLQVSAVMLVCTSQYAFKTNCSKKFIKYICYITTFQVDTTTKRVPTYPYYLHPQDCFSTYKHWATRFGNENSRNPDKTHHKKFCGNRPFRPNVVFKCLKTTVNISSMTIAPA